MSLFLQSDCERFAEAFVVANTPSSFAAWLERDVTVVRLAECTTEDVLLDELHTSLRRAPKTDMVVAASYALLIAIGIQRRLRGTVSAIPPIDLAHLAWGRAIWERLARSPIGTTTFTISAGPDTRAATYGDLGGSQLFGADGRPLARSY